MSVSASLLYEIERYVNNYFNPKNIPTNKIRNYPHAFLELAKKIEDYNKNITKTAMKSETNDGYSYTLDLNYLSWQKAFAQELTLYKRVKTL